MKFGILAVRMEHVMAIAAALLVGAAVLFYSGDADPLLAIESGAAAGAFSYFISYLRAHGWCRRKRVNTRGPSV